MMSGTSLDGMDLALCRFEHDEERGFSFSLLDTYFVEYDENLRKEIQNIYSGSALEMTESEQKLSEIWAFYIKKFAEKQSEKIDAVAMHGQTIFHNPEKKYTKQIGNPSCIAAAVGLPVLADFRSLDVALGGQGAPLVPVGDKLLFPQYDFCLNLGGIANISSRVSSGDVIAYDICPFNLVLNSLASERGCAYDEGGGLAAKGKEISELLFSLRKIPFYGQKPPRSLGREQIEDTFLPLINSFEATTEDKLHTYTLHIAEEVAKCVYEGAKVLVTGGGAKNAFFIEKLSNKRKDVKFIIPDERIADFKEAVVFAFLGYLRLHEAPNALASVTGASKDNCGGAIWLP